MIFLYINMSTLQYKFITIKINEFIIYGLKNKMQAIRIFYLVGVPNASMKHMPLPILYCGTVMEAL